MGIDQKRNQCLRISGSRVLGRLMSLNCGARKKITIKPASSKISKFKRDEKKNTTSRKRKKNNAAARRILRYSHSLILFKRKKLFEKFFCPLPVFVFVTAIFSFSFLFLQSSSNLQRNLEKKKNNLFFKKKKRKSRRWHILPAAKILLEKKNNTNKVFLKKHLLELSCLLI